MADVTPFISDTGATILGGILGGSYSLRLILERLLPSKDKERAVREALGPELVEALRAMRASAEGTVTIMRDLLAQAQSSAQVLRELVQTSEALSHAVERVEGVVGRVERQVLSLRCVADGPAGEGA